MQASMEWVRRCGAVVALTMVMAGGACGGDDSQTTVDAGADASTTDATSDGPVTTDAGADSGEASTTYPAFQPPVPQIVKGSASVMGTPKIRPVFFPNDPLQTDIENQLAQWIGSSAWTAQTSEYGVGAATLASITLTEAAPTTILDTEIDAWLATKLGSPPADAGVTDAGVDPLFGPADATTLANEVFVLFYPSTTTIKFGTQSACPSVTSYRTDIAVSGSNAVYAVVPRCTMVASDLVGWSEFEILGSVTDPQVANPPTAPTAFGAWDSAHLVWDALSYSTGVDVAHPCQRSPFLTIDAGTVARSWSNAAIKAYHDPCVPYPDATPYFASVPILTDDVMYNGQTTKGVHLAAGQKKTIDVQLISDGPTGPWTVEATNADSVGRLIFAFDRAVGSNGDTLHLTITANSSPQAFVLTSTAGNGKKTYWVGLVAP